MAGIDDRWLVGRKRGPGRRTGGWLEAFSWIARCRECSALRLYYEHNYAVAGDLVFHGLICGRVPAASYADRILRGKEPTDLPV